jgi:proteic killer suppression protein
VDVSFGNDALDELERNPCVKTKLDVKLVRAFRRVMNYVRTAADERDLYAHPGLHFEKMKGDLDGCHSLRLNDQWRLIVEVREGQPRNRIHVLDIKDPH